MQAIKTIGEVIRQEVSLLKEAREEKQEYAAPQPFELPGDEVLFDKIRAILDSDSTADFKRKLLKKVINDVDSG